MSECCRAVLCLLLMLPTTALSQTFEKVKIKPAASADPRNERVQVLPNGDLIARAVPVITLLSYAYDVPSNPSPRLLAVPGWAVRERYDIEAKAPVNAIPASVPDNEVQARVKQMIRHLLAERFHLKMRSESERMAVYILTVPSGAPHLQKSTLTTKECVFDTSLEGCHNFAVGFGHPLIARAASMDDLAHYIENWTDLPVMKPHRPQRVFHSEHGGLASHAIASAAAWRHSKRKRLRQLTYHFHCPWQAGP